MMTQSPLKITGYEQILLLGHLNKDMLLTEMAEACRAVDCSWDEAYQMAEHGYVEIKADDNEQRVLIRITGQGMCAVEYLRATDPKWSDL